MSVEGQGVRVSIIGAELDQASVENTVKPLLDAQRAAIIGALQIPAQLQLAPLLDAQTQRILDGMPAVQANEASFQRVRTDIAELPQLLAGAIPAATPIQPLLDAQTQQILNGIPATPSNASAFAQVRADIAQIPGRIVIPQPAPGPDLTPDVNELKGMVLALQQQVTALAILMGMAVPNRPPVVSLTATALTGAVSLSVIATDPDGTITKVEIYRNGLLIATITSQTLGAYVYTDSGLAPNQYAYVAKAYDNATPAAVTSSSTSLITVSPVTVQPPAPDFTMTLSALALTDPGAILLTASPPTVTTRRVEFIKDGAIVGIWTPPWPYVNLTTPVLCSQWGLTPGTYQYQSKAYEADGAILMSSKVPVMIGVRPAGQQIYMPPTDPIGTYDPSAPVYAVPPVDPGLPGQTVMPIEIITI